MYPEITPYAPSAPLLREPEEGEPGFQPGLPSPRPIEVEGARPLSEYQVDVLEGPSHSWVATIASLVKFVFHVCTLGFVYLWDKGVESEMERKLKYDDCGWYLEKELLIEVRSSTALSAWKYNLRLSEEFYKDGKLEKAIEHFGLVPIWRESAGAHFLMGKIRAAQGNFFDAYLHLEKSHEKDPANVGRAALDAQKQIITLIQQKEKRSLEEQYILALDETLSKKTDLTESERFLLQSVEENRSIQLPQYKNLNIIHSRGLKSILSRVEQSKDASTTSIYAIGLHLDVLHKEGAAVKHIADAAWRGDSRAQMWLGRHNFNHGNIYGAIEQFKKAALQGDAEAQYLLGSLYLRETSRQQGIEWLTKAAEQGNKKAARSLGDVYLNGTGTLISEDIFAGKIVRTTFIIPNKPWFKFYLENAVKWYLMAEANEGMIACHCKYLQSQHGLEWRKHIPKDPKEAALQWANDLLEAQQPGETA